VGHWEYVLFAGECECGPCIVSFISKIVFIVEGTFFSRR